MILNAQLIVGTSFPDTEYTHGVSRPTTFPVRQISNIRDSKYTTGIPHSLSHLTYLVQLLYLEKLSRPIMNLAVNC